MHVFSTHLDWYNKAHCTAQLLDLMDWTKGFGARRIVGGDFNSWWWGEYWIITMMGDYYDTWFDVTGSKQNGHTVNNAVRFDYLFRAKHGADHVKPTKVFAPMTSLSDHNPVIADYKVTPLIHGNHEGHVPWLEWTEHGKRRHSRLLGVCA